MKYTVYRITNLVNGKFYIGKHMTTDTHDNYMGSGKLLRRAMKKYGSENFHKEILGVYETEHEMNMAEKILVVLDKEVSYNLCPGGQGGWGYITEHKLQNTPRAIQIRRENGKRTRKLFAEQHRYRFKNDPEYRARIIKKITDAANENPSFLGRTHSEATKEKMRNSHRGKRNGANNSQFGSMWITNGTENKKIKGADTIPTGWKRGRTI